MRALGIVTIFLISIISPIMVQASNDTQIVPEINSRVDLETLSLLSILPTSQPEQGWYDSQLGSGVIDLQYRDATVTPVDAWSEYTGNHDALSGWFVLTHAYPVPSSWKHQLDEAGIECYSFLPPNGFHCSLDNVQIELLAGLNVEGMVQLDPTDKVREDLVRAFVGQETIAPSPFADTTGGLVSVVLSGESLPSGIESQNGIEVLETSGRFAFLSITPEALPWLLNQGAVEWIEARPWYELQNNEAQVIIKAEDLWDQATMTNIDASWLALDGSGITVTVADTGLDNGVNNSNMHPDFIDHIVDITSHPFDTSGYNWCGASTYDDGAADTDSGHGTHVAGSVLGDGSDSNGDIKGMAPESHLYFQAVEQYCPSQSKYTLMGIPNDLNDLFAPAVGNGSRVHTNSWGSAVEGQYTTSSMQADISARAFENLTILFAAANEGVDDNLDGEVDLDSLGSPASAKNVLSVGASENDRATFCLEGGTPCYGVQTWGNDYGSPISSDKSAGEIEGLAAFSSRGPTDDGRLKPDISAPGTWILSTKSRDTTDTGWYQFNSSYTFMGGTSMATPLTAGATALLLEHLIENLNHSEPSSALVKGIFAASAHDMLGQYSSSTNGAGESAPNNHEGWGRVDMRMALNTSWIDGESVQTSDEAGWTFNVGANAPDLQISLSWIDPASTPSAGGNLVNNLDLAVKDPSGTWTNLSNNVDNLLGLTFSTPAQGQWEVHVIGTNVPIGPQKYALVINHDTTIANMTQDADLDGFDDDVDDCPSVFGLSSQDRMGCPDTDSDGYSDADNTWTIVQGADAYPNDATQWKDSDNDGYGDNIGGTTPDACPLQSGTSVTDRYGCLDPDTDGWSSPDVFWTTVSGADGCEDTWGNSTGDVNGCPDSDGDSYSNDGDAFPNDATEWLDPDGDGIGSNSDACPNEHGNSTEDRIGCIDQDGDGWSNDNDAFPNDVTEWLDSDADSIGDNTDDCPNVAGTSTQDLLGCLDSDADGWSDSGDAFPNDVTEWTDEDGDGFGDNSDDCLGVVGNSSQDQQGCIDSDGDGWSDVGDMFVNDPLEWIDSDSDSIGDNADDCPNTIGNSTADLQGCVDSDSDGWSDSGDAFPADPLEWGDEDLDGFGDNTDDCVSVSGNSTIGLLGCIDADGDGRPALQGLDLFPMDPTQWADQDGDGFGDNPSGSNADACPSDSGSSWRDSHFGCPDTDGDGWANEMDDFENDKTQWLDTDEDGYGDNVAGNTPDTCPEVSGNSTMEGTYGCPDADGDGYANLIDAFDNDPTQTHDTDQDGFGDNPLGMNADDCPTVYGNSTVDRRGCEDRDGDGVSDLQDSFPDDPTRSVDSDGDGFSDIEDDCWDIPGTSTNGRLGCVDADFDTWDDQTDAFELDPTQWNDTDGDGFGDNWADEGLNATRSQTNIGQWVENATQSDHCPEISGNSSLDFFGCVDADGDGWSLLTDLFDTDVSEWNDTDSDGFGDNQDVCPAISGSATNGSIGCVDTDMDGWSDDVDFDANDPLKWVDVDGDGWSNFDDDCPLVNGTSTMDSLGCFDLDKDGWSDAADAFPDVDSQWNDTDRDGYGDNNQPGAYLADHWPEDPAKNIAEVSMICDDEILQIDLKFEDMFSFSCTVENQMGKPLNLRLSIRQTTVVDPVLRTQMMYFQQTDGQSPESQMLAFSGKALVSGKHTLVVESTELGGSAALATYTIQLEVIDSTEPETEGFSDSTQSATIPHLQEIVASSAVLVLILILFFSKMRSKRLEKQRLLHLQQMQMGQSAYASPDFPGFHGFR